MLQESSKNGEGILMECVEDPTEFPRWLLKASSVNPEGMVQESFRGPPGTIEASLREFQRN